MVSPYYGSGSDQDWEYAAQEEGFSRLPGGYGLYVIRRRRVWRPPTDVYETRDHVVVKVEIAGIRPEDLDISVNGRHLVIAGHRQGPTGQVIYQNMEIHHGEFRTEVRFDRVLDASEVTATYEDGFLFVTLPRSKETRIAVRVRNEGQD